MKKEKRQRQNPSGKVLVGLAAVGVAGNASGAIVQIDLIGNWISRGGNFLNADLTGDGVADVSLVPLAYGSGVNLNGSTAQRVTVSGGSYYLSIVPGYGRGKAWARVGASRVEFALAHIGDRPTFGVGGRVPVVFDATSLGGGGAVSGVVGVFAGRRSHGAAVGAWLDAVYFDDGGAAVGMNTDLSGARVIGSTVNGIYTGVAIPEPSGLALLALGAAGLLTRRQRKRALGGEG